MLRFIDGFDHYANVYNKYASVIGNVETIPYVWRTSEPNDPRPHRNDNRVLVCKANSGVIFVNSGGNSTGTLLGAAIYITESPSIDGGAVSRNFISFGTQGVGGLKLSSEKRVGLGLTADRKFVVTGWGLTCGGFLDVTSCNLFPTTTNSIDLNTWYYIEMKVNHASTSPRNAYTTNIAVELRVNGSSTGWVPPSIYDFATAVTVDTIALGSPHRVAFNSATANIYFDDVYFADNVAGGVTDFLGDSRVMFVMPESNGTTTQFTPSSGLNYQAVDEVPPDSNTSFVISNSENQIDLYNYPNLPHYISGFEYNGPFYGIQTDHLSKKTETGLVAYKPIERINNTIYEGIEHYPSMGTYNFDIHLQEKNPATDSSWTSTTFNSTEFGQKRTK